MMKTNTQENWRGQHRLLSLGSTDTRKMGAVRPCAATPLREYQREVDLLLAVHVSGIEESAAQFRYTTHRTDGQESRYSHCACL